MHSLKIKKFLIEELLLTEEILENNEIIFSSNLRDSIDFMKLISFVEKKLKVKIPKKKLDFRSFDTFDKMLKTLSIS